MLLGQKLPAPYQDWRVVESDLYDVASRVREYDPEARLVRNDQTGQLGLGVWHRSDPRFPDGSLTLKREMFDFDTDAPLIGEPDPRALRCQRGYDVISRWGSLSNFLRAQAEAEDRRAYRAALESEESFGDHSERYVHAYGKDLGVTKRAFIRDYERAVA